MTKIGDKILIWAHRRCEEEGPEHSDSNLLMFISELELELCAACEAELEKRLG